MSKWNLTPDEVIARVTDAPLIAYALYHFSIHERDWQDMRGRIQDCGENGFIIEKEGVVLYGALVNREGAEDAGFDELEYTFDAPLDDEDLDALYVVFAAGDARAIRDTIKEIYDTTYIENLIYYSESHRKWKMKYKRRK